MAGVGTVIKQVSKLSFSLHKMTETLNTIETAVGEAFASTAVQEITEKVNHYETSLLNVENQLMNVDTRLTQIYNQTKKVEKSGTLLSNAYKKVASAVKTIDIKDVLNKSDELMQTMMGLDWINDGAQPTSKLFDMIFASAKNAHAPLMSTVDAILKMSNNIGDLFGSNREAIDFVNQFNKQCSLGGTSIKEQSSALEQLSDSMVSGVIKGSELNTILDAAPGIAEALAKKMNWSEESLISYADQGKISAELIKNLMLSMSEETNKAFKDIPLRFSQAITDIESDAVNIFQPVFGKLSSVTQSEVFGAFITNAINGLAVVANITMTIMDLVGAVAGFTYENWSVISPLIYGAVAALGVYMLALGANNAMQAINGMHKAFTTVQEYKNAKALLAAAAAARIEADETVRSTVAHASFNTKLLASPLTWFILKIVAVITVVSILASGFAKLSEKAQTGFGVILGAVSVLGVFIWNTILGVINGIIQFLWTKFIQPFVIAIEFLINVIDGGFDSLSGAIGNLFGNFISWLLSFAKVATKVIDAVFGSELTANIENLQNELQSIGKNEDAVTLNMNPIERGKRISYGETWERMTAVGDSVSEKVANSFSIFNTSEPILEDYYSTEDYQEFNPENYEPVSEDINNNVSTIADNTASLNDSIDISNENLEYLKDVAERDAINRFTTAQIKVNMNNNNNISNGMDLDGVINYLTAGVTEAMGQAAEGVHA